MSMRYTRGTLLLGPGDDCDKAVTAGKKVYTFVLSSEAPDRDGDVILASAWDLGNYKKNPVFLFGHDRGEIIGKCTNARVEGKQLLIDVQFADTKDGMEAEMLVEFGALSAVSAGFRIKAIESDENKRSAAGVGKYGLLIIEAELLEASLVAIPANQEALRLREDAGELCAKALDAIAPPVTQESIKALSNRITALELALAAFEGGTSGKELASAKGSPSSETPSSDSEQDPYALLMKSVAIGRVKALISRG